jgi:hypothetical protein
MSYDVVNGYFCRNCTDVDYAKRNIDPQHPKDGPFGINRDPGAGHGPAVVLGGSLAKPASASAPNGPNGVAQVNASRSADGAAPGRAADQRRIDISV